MCIILSVYNDGKPEKEVVKRIKDIIIEESRFNGDGISILTINPDKPEKRLKKLKLPEKAIDKLLSENHNINFHLRNATTGKINTDNLHFWRYEDWYFGHNGMIAKYNFGKDAEKCDSLKFFEGLLGEKLIGDNGNINYKKIKKFSKTLGLWGRFILVNAKFKKVYYFGDWKVYFLKGEKSKSLVISSKDLGFEKEQSFYGFEFQGKDDNVLEDDFEGILVMDVKKKLHKIKDDEPLETDFDARFGFEKYDGWDKKYQWDSKANDKAIEQFEKEEKETIEKDLKEKQVRLIGIDDNFGM